MRAEKAFEETSIEIENRVPRWVLPSVKILIIAVDALLASLCFVIAFYFRLGEGVLSQTAWAWNKSFVPYAGILFFVIPIRVAMLAYQRMYRLQGAFSYIAEFIKVVKAISIGSLLIIAITFLFRGGFAFRQYSYSRGVFLWDFALALVAFSVFHLGLRYAQTLVRRRDINLIPTLIIGSGSDTDQTIRELRARPDFGYRVVGIIANDTDKNDTSFDDIPFLGNLDALPRIIRRHAIQEVIITDNRIPSEKLFEAMMQIDRGERVEFRLAPSLFNFLPQKTSVEQIGILPMVRLFREPLSDAERFLKRASDIFISASVLAILSPLLLTISVLIRLDSKGRILFRQERVGMDGRKFLCFKFRTMFADADETFHREYYKKNIEGDAGANSGDEENPVYGKPANDSRVTRIGRILRRTSLDEIPQLINVLVGDMSIVGPRPPIPYEVEEYDLWHRKRLEMKPGVTGLWQVSGRNRLTFEEMVRRDLYYIENWSLWLDLKIILLTLPAVFRGDGAR